jgi:D-alanyl-D-alanine carboxypeptidase/D-alanyl-D-alanine-endopeptidase (penicillin-binding protein 4)
LNARFPLRLLVEALAARLMASGTQAKAFATRAIFVSAVIACASCASAPQQVADTLGAGAAAQPVATPPPSPSPSPPVWTPAQRAALSGTLGATLDADVLEEGAGIAVVAADGTTLYERRAAVPVAPASTLKLVVAASALNAFGPQHRFTTRFLTLGPPDADGVIHGPLWLVGGGDPLLTSNDLRAGVGALVRAGVTRIDGPLVLDDTAFAGPLLNAHWEADDLDEAYAAPTSALSLDGNTVEFDVTPGSPGEPALVTVEPPNDLVHLDGSIQTVSAYSDSFVSIEPASQYGTLHSNDFQLDGRIAAGEEQKFWKPVANVSEYALGALKLMLAQRGIACNCEIERGPAPLAAQPLWTHSSLPLSAIVAEMLTNSNNHSAEQLLRSLGARSGHAGTDASGVSEERGELARLRLSRSGMRLYDGSGLSPDDRVEPIELAKLVAAELGTPAGNDFLRGLPRVGLDGTVIHHNLTEALGRARAKSGHIDGVNGLVGTVLTRHHGRVAFAFIVNDPRYQAGAITDEEDRALDALATF